ncbi:DUF3987 domain-containing protein [Oryzifoliimicrobium ureilyticus]|uniref:DUF3987 domain-containing protein n=1 Tax=Oryzifoliimicrobium ureilyticus TaxID=3113724 RepID=UPI0030762CD7
MDTLNSRYGRTTEIKPQNIASQPAPGDNSPWWDYLQKQRAAGRSRAANPTPPSADTDATARTPSFAEQLAARRAERLRDTAPTCGVAAPSTQKDDSERSADRDQIKKFCNVIFKRCVDEAGNLIAGRLVLRAVRNTPKKGHDFPTVSRSAITHDDGLIDKIASAATDAARLHGDDASVFCPPVCLFSVLGKSGESDVLAGPAIAVDLDTVNPIEGKQRLETVLGPATLVVRSGGIWKGPGGELLDKLHLYWRLKRPAVTDDEKALLKAVRKRAAELVGGDATAAPLSHPLRWPGSWHTKDEKNPRICRIIGGDQEREIDLNDAAILLDAETSNLQTKDRKQGQFTTPTAWTAEQLMDVAENIPNEDLHWDGYNTIGLAFFDASHGFIDGLEAFIAFSAKSEKHDEEYAEQRWEHYKSHPPDRVSGSFLIEQARKVDPLYCLPLPAISDEERVRLHELWHRQRPSEDKADATVEPHDIFNHDLPLDLRDPPAGCLPGLVDQWARSEARRKGTPLAFPAAAAITAIGAAIGSSLKIQVRQNDTTFVEPASLWTAIVAAPGSAKSAIISAAIKPLQELNAQWLKEDLPKHAAWCREVKAAARKKEAQPPTPRIRRMIVDDVTIESQIRIHAANPKGILRAPDELSGFVESFGAYKRNGGADRSMALRLFDGGSVNVDRVSSEPLFAEHALMSVIAGSQPDKIASLVDDLKDDGMLQRFLFIMDDSARECALDEAEDSAAANRYRQLLQKLATETYVFPTSIKMEPAAYDDFRAFHAQTLDLAHLPGSSSAWKGHLSKMEKIAARIVLIFHCVDMFDRTGEIDCELPVPQPTARRALAFCRFLLRHSLAFYSKFFDPDPAYAEALKLAGYLLTKPELRSLGQRDIYRGVRTLGGAENRRALFAVARSLEDAGWISVKSRAAEGPTEWTVNPLVHTRFKERAAYEREERARAQEDIRMAVEARSALQRGV